MVDQAQASVALKAAARLLQLPGGGRIERAHLEQAPMAAAQLRSWKSNAEVFGQFEGNCDRASVHRSYPYLKDVLPRLPGTTNRQIPEVTPEAWAKAQLQRPRQQALKSSEQNHLTLLLSLNVLSRDGSCIAYSQPMYTKEVSGYHRVE